MAGLTITAAAKAVGLSRQHLHRAYIKTGQLSVSRDDDGRPFIDPAELVRVFGAKVKLGDTGDGAATEPGRHTETDQATAKSDAETAVLRATVTLQQQQIDELRHDKRRLEADLDRVHRLLEHRPPPSAQERQAAAADLIATDPAAMAMPTPADDEPKRARFWSLRCWPFR